MWLVFLPTGVNEIVSKNGIIVVDIKENDWNKDFYTQNVLFDINFRYNIYTIQTFWDPPF